MVEIHSQQTIAVPVEEAFDWMADPPIWLQLDYAHPVWAGGKLLRAVTNRLESRAA
jgi:hypothetical protein